MNHNIKKIFEQVEFETETLICDILQKSRCVQEIEDNKHTLKKFIKILDVNNIFVCEQYKIEIINTGSKKQAANKIYQIMLKKELINFEQPIVIEFYIRNNNLKKIHRYECSREKLKNEICVNGTKYTHATKIKRLFIK